MKTKINLKATGLWMCLLIMSISAVYGNTFDERKKYILNHYAATYPHAQFWGDNDVKTAMGYVLSRLALKKDVPQALDMMDRMQDQGFDMFDCHGNIDAYFRFTSSFSKELKAKIRKRMTDYDYTGNGSTENHKLMFKTAGYLTALAFPDWKESKYILEHCRTELFNMMDDMVRYGIKEYDSTTYGTFYITCLLSLYDHSTDPEMKNKAQMTLEWHLLNFAPEWLNGYFVSSTLREYQFACSPRLENSYPLVGWLLFGGGPNPDLVQRFEGDKIIVNNEGFFVPLVALTSYRVPEIIINIARDRSKAYVHRESHDMNPHSQLNFPWGFKKYTYVNKNYALASQWDGISLGWSAQMRRWKLVWESDAPASTFFATHPCYYTGSESTLIGATPREQVLQHNGTLMAMYKIESNEPYPYVSGVFPADAIREMREDKSGWIFCDGGSILFAVRFAHPYSWDEDRYFRDVRHRMIRCDQRYTALILETALPDEYSKTASQTALDLFAEDVLKNTSFEYNAEDVECSTAHYTSRKGDKLEMKFNRERSVNGREVDYNNWPLMSDCWMDQAVDGRFLTLTYGNKSRVYDFREWKIISDNSPR